MAGASAGGAGALALVLVDRGAELAAWSVLGLGVGLAGGLTYVRSLARIHAERKSRMRLQAEAEVQHLALEKALLQLDEAKVAARAAERHAARARELEERILALQSQAALGRMAGGVAHSFNNMLVGIMGYASAVEEVNHLTPSEMRQYLSQINAASQRASALCFQLMVAAGRRSADAEVVFLRRFRAEIEPLLSACVGRGAALTLELSPNLPRVRCDLGGLQIALANLTFNALDAIAGQGGQLTLTIEATTLDASHIGMTPEMTTIEPGPYVRFRLQDDGVGISAEVKPQIFAPFFSTKSGRLGLGLTAVARWARKLHGGLLVEAVEPRGTRVELFLPALPGSDDPADNTQAPFEKTRVENEEASAGPEPAAAVANRRVLFVDDDQTVRDLAAMLIRQLGLEVVCASDGHMAEALLREHAPVGLAMVDYSMPGRDGVDTIQALRQVQPGLRVVLISGSMKSEIDNLATVEPLVGFLQKPFNYTAVKGLLLKLMGGQS